MDWLEEKFSGIGAAAPPTPDVSAETWLRLQVVTQRMDSLLGAGTQCLHCCQPRPAEPSSSPAALLLMHRRHQQQQRLRLTCADMQ